MIVNLKCAFRIRIIKRSFKSTIKMADNHVPCEMCCKEQAVGYCNTCGNIGESCFGIHKIGRAFQTHILKMYGNDGYNSRSFIYDITEEICKHHPTERALLFCQIHELMICGRCFRSDHISCGHKVVDMCLEANHIDYDKFNAMSAALNALKDDSKRIKEEVDRKKERSSTHVVKCKKELDDLEYRLKQKVEHSISMFKEDVQIFHEENIAAFSCISSICEENVSWAIQEESKLNEFVNNSFTGRLYLMSRNFEMRISKAKKQIKEAEYKNTFKNVCLKENMAALKCLIEDLTDVCELQEEVDGSDEVTTLSIGNATVENEKTRKELFEELIQAKLDTAIAETARNEFKEQFLQAKRDLENSEKTLKGLEQESLNTKQNMEKSEKTREKLCDELQQVKQKLDHSEKTRERFEQDLQKAKQDIDKSEKIRNQLSYDLSLVKQELNWSEKTRMEFDEDLQQAKQNFYESEQVKNEIEKELIQAKQGCKKSEKTKDGLQQEKLHAKTGLDKSEKIRNEIEKELLQAKQGWENSEKMKDGLQHELLKAKIDLDKSEQVKHAIATDLLEWKQGCGLAKMARQNVEDELERTKKELDLYQKERAILQAHFKDHLNWTQPTGGLEVKISFDTSVPIIKLDYTFLDGFQTRNHPFPGNPYKGDSFTVRLRDDSEGRLACRMLKAAFRKGRMFIIGTDGIVVMDGLFLYNGPVESINHFGGDLNSGYVGYIKRLKGKLADKGIADADIDDSDNLEETFTVESLSLLEAALSTVEIADECIGEAN